MDGDELDETPQPSRRTFLQGAAGLTGVALAVGAWKPVFAMEDAPVTAASNRSFGTSHIALTLGESSAGFISHAEGGNAFSDVVNEKLGPDGITRKHLAGVKYEDISISCGTGMSKAFYDWVGSSFGTEKFVRMSGAIDAMDFNFKVRSEMTFSNAMITEVGFPALDAASKDTAKMTVKFAPEFTRTSAKSGMTLKGATNQKVVKWLASNFKLTLDGVDTSHVDHVDAFALTFDVITNTDGNAVGRSVNVPNMKVRIPAASAADFIKWHEDFVINGNNGQEQEKTGRISYLGPALATEIFRLDLGNVGIFALDYDALDAGTDAVRHVTVQLYAETMKFFNLHGSSA